MTLNHRLHARTSKPSRRARGNAIRIDGDVAYIALHQGFEALIDAADVPLVEGYTWTAFRTTSGDWYANSKTGGGHTYLHRLIAGARDGDGMEVDHINHHTLDCRRQNVRIVTHAKNSENRAGAYNISKTKVRGVSEHKTGRGGKLYVFRCHVQRCKEIKYFVYTPEGLARATAYARAHYAALEQDSES